MWRRERGDEWGGRKGTLLKRSALKRESEEIAPFTFAV